MESIRIVTIAEEITCRVPAFPAGNEGRAVSALIQQAIPACGSHDIEWPDGRSARIGARDLLARVKHPVEPRFLARMLEEIVTTRIQLPPGTFVATVVTDLRRLHPKRFATPGL